MINQKKVYLPVGFGTLMPRWSLLRFWTKLSEVWILPRKPTKLIYRIPIGFLDSRQGIAWESLNARYGKSWFLLPAIFRLLLRQMATKFYNGKLWGSYCHSVWNVPHLTPGLRKIPLAIVLPLRLQPRRYTARALACMLNRVGFFCREPPSDRDASNDSTRCWQN